MTDPVPLQAVVPEALAGQRLDQALASLFADYSRERLKQWIKQGHVTLNGEVVSRPRDKVAGGEQVVVRVQSEPQGEWQAESIPLRIVYQDDHLLVVDKPVGLVVHPAAGNYDGTLLNALLHHDPALRSLPRAGIVHRLDKETSGLMVVARTLPAQHALVRQLQARTVHRSYQAVVWGVLIAGGTVEAPIGRHPVHRQRMAVVAGGREAITHYRVAERFRAHTLLNVQLETGRTHQIRVHMAHLHHPLVGDPVYGGRHRQLAGAGESLAARLASFRRQALHAGRLELIHPASGEQVGWEAPPPEDMVDLIAALREDAAGG